MASFSTLDDDLAVSVASYGAPEDLLNLALTCRRLGSKMGAVTRREWRALARDAKRQKSSLRGWSLMEEAARCVMDKSMIVKERICLPPRDGDGWMARYHELIMLRRPLTFDRLGCGVIHANEDKSEVRVEKVDAPHNRSYCTALSSHVMRAGKHYASFTGTEHARVGVFRPTTTALLEREGLKYGDLMECINDVWDCENVNYCAIDFAEGCYCWSGQGVQVLGMTEAGRIGLSAWDYCYWLGQEAFEENDTAGLLLDLDEGTLTVYKNGRKLGIMKSGLAGEYCWGMSGTDYWSHSVRISRGSIPE